MTTRSRFKHANAPNKGQTVVYFVDGVPGGKTTSAKVIEILPSGWSLKLELPTGEVVVAVAFAPASHVDSSGIRPPGSWDFIY
jgi:hypothetical protein